MGTVKSVATATTPSEGLVTWESEGTEGGKYHSRKLHVPSDSSGLTIGRGYDMKEREIHEIVQDLCASDVSKAEADALSQGAGLSGDAALKFITTAKLQKFEISKPGQKLLFDRTYAVIKADVQRICAKVDVVAKYGASEWASLDKAIIEILVDLRFRGDYTPTARTLVQPSVVKNDLVAFATALMKSANWVNVPKDRFNRRNDFLAAALKTRKPASNPLSHPGSLMPAGVALPVSRIA